MNTSTSPAPLRILYLEDSLKDQELTVETLRDEGLVCEFVLARSRAEFERGLDQDLDLILSDFTLPGFDGLTALSLAMERKPEVPFVYISGTIGEERAVESLRLGATDYVLKHRLERLAPVLRRALREAELRRSRQRAEEALRESSLLNQQIIASAREGIVVYDREFRYRLWNPFMEEITGLPAAAVVGRKATEVFPFLNHERMRESWSRTLAGKETLPLLFEYYIPQTGRSGWIAGTDSPLRNARGEVVGILRVAHDVTEERRANNQLEESRRLLKAILDNIPDPAWLKDTEGRFLACNAALARFYQRSAAEILGKTAAQVTPENAKCLDEFDRQLLVSGQPLRLEHTLRDPSGKERWFETIKAPVLDDQGRITRVAGIAREITERRQLEAQLRQAQKLEAIGQLAGGVAHDFNNVLAVIRGYADLLLLESERLGPETQEGLNQVVAAAERAANLTRQLLVFSRKQAAQLQPVCLNEVLTNLTKMLKRIIGEQINLRCQFQEALPLIQADTSMMEQVIINLVINARDAMPRSGCLWLETRALTLEAAQVRTNPEARPGRFVCLSVRDNGTGIAPEHRPHIFEPFFTTKGPGQGTGLGLATVYGIVKQHQGWVEVASAPDAGATFQVFFPVLATPAALPATAPNSAALPRGNETILLVEDELSVRAIVRRVLENHGYRILESGSAPEALKLWSEQTEKIDLLLTDMVMPQGVTGRALAQQLQAQRPGLKVVFMSGYSQDIIGNDTDFLRRQQGHFLRKPCPAATLLQTVRRVLDGQ